MTLFDGKPIEPEEILVICDSCKLGRHLPLDDEGEPIGQCKKTKGLECECPECNLVEEEEL